MSDFAYDFLLPGGATIVISGADGKAGELTSTGLKVLPPYPDGIEDAFHNYAIDGMESLLLNLATHGVDLSDQRVVQAISDTVEAIGNNV